MGEQISRNNKILNYIHLFLAIFILGWLNVNSSIYNNIPAIIKIVAFIVWFFLASFNRKFIKIIMIQSLPLIAMLLLMAIGKSSTLAQFYIRNFVYMFIAYSIYLYYSNENYKKYRRIILIFLIIDTIYIGINTYIELLKNPLLARYLSTGAKSQEILLKGEKYEDVGSYGFFYSLVMIILVFLYQTLKQKKYKILNIIVIILSVLFLIKGQFTISVVLLVICSVMVLILYRKKDKDYGKFLLKIIFSITIVMLIFANTANILTFISNIPILPKEVSLRMIEMRDVMVYGESSGKTDLEKRIELYKTSLDVFFDNMFIGSFGDNIVGRHSSMLDLMGLYGVFSFLVFYYIYLCYKNIRRFCKNNYMIMIIFIYYILLSVINTSVFTNIFVTLFVFMPFAVKEIADNIPTIYSNIDVKDKEE